VTLAIGHLVGVFSESVNQPDLSCLHQSHHWLLSIRMDPSNLKTISIIFGWFGANITTVILNKHIFQNLGWLFPVSLTIVHMVTCLVGSFLVLKVFKMAPFVHLSWNEWLKGVLPLRYAQRRLFSPSLFPMAFWLTSSDIVIYQLRILL